MEIVFHKLFLFLIKVQSAQQVNMLLPEFRRDHLVKDMAEQFLLEVDNPAQFFDDEFGIDVELPFGLPSNAE